MDGDLTDGEIAELRKASGDLLERGSRYDSKILRLLDEVERRRAQEGTVDEEHAAMALAVYDLEYPRK